MGTTLDVAPRLPVGSTVEAHPRLVDTLTGPPVTKAAASGKVGKDGKVTFTGLVEHGPYFAVGTDVNGEHAAINFTADGQHAPADDRYTQPESAAQSLREANAAGKVREGQPAIAGSSAAGRTVVTGPRNSVNAVIHKEDPEPLPAPHQRDMGNAVQRSNTPEGQGTPKDVNELQPKPDQASVKKGTVQRSQTPQGEATPVDPGETVPDAKQEDTRGAQRSQTETGQATPKPRTRSKRQQQKARDSSVSKARGGTKPVAGSSKGKRAASPIKTGKRKG